MSKKCLVSDGEDLTWVGLAVTITLKHRISQNRKSAFYETRRKSMKKRQKRQEGKKNKFPFSGKSVVTLCWWTCSARRDEKELPRLWNPPVKINILFKLPTEKGRVEMRGGKKKRKEGWKVGEGLRKRHSWEGVGGAVGKTDNCLPCSNSGGQAWLECAQCVGVWESEWCGSTTDRERWEGDYARSVSGKTTWKQRMVHYYGDIISGLNNYVCSMDSLHLLVFSPGRDGILNWWT